MNGMSKAGALDLPMEFSGHTDPGNFGHSLRVFRTRSNQKLSEICCPTCQIFHWHKPLDNPFGRKHIVADVTRHL